MVLFKEDNENYTDEELDEIEFNLRHGLNNNIKAELLRIDRSVLGWELSDVVINEEETVETVINFLYINNDDEVAIIDLLGHEESFMYLIGSWSISTLTAWLILSSLKNIDY